MFESWLDWIKSLSMKEIDLGLDRVHQVLKRLDLSLESTVITVAGTNGKGSTVAGLEAIYLEASKSTGAFTSPYLLHYNEQVRLQGKPVSDQILIDAFQEIKKHSENIPLTPFEFGTLAALWVFKQHRLDVVILEVGLGGRLDAVNAIDSDVSVVTSIALDHMEWLGTTREAIAREKSGIFRPGKPAVCGDFDPPLTLIQHAEAIGSPLFCQRRDFEYQENGFHWNWWSDNKQFCDLPKTALALQNMSTVLKVVELLQPSLPVKREAIDRALKRVTLPGRIQVIPGKIKKILDVSHNPASVALLSDYLKKNPVLGKTRAVFSMLKDKDIFTSLKVIKNVIDHWYIAPLRTSRGMSEDKLRDIFQKENMKNWKMYACIEDAYKTELDDANENDRIVVFGSFHTVAEILRLLSLTDVQ